MRWCWRLSSLLFVLVAVASLMSCAVVDQYSSRAVVYNIEAERAQEQALLLNIVRAYLRRPMQFTTVSSITGSASASGGLQYTNPVNVPFRPTTNGSSIASFPPVPSWTVNGSMSGGPIFTVPVLDTQEFYRGLLTPIPVQVWDLYIQNAYPRDLLFNLIVEKIVIKRLDKACDVHSHGRECELVIHNQVGDDAEIELFQIFADYLLALGLTTEADKKKSPELLKKAVNVNLNVRGSSEAATATPSSGDAGPKPYSLCFAPRNRSDSTCVIHDSLCGVSDTTQYRPESAVQSGPRRDCSARDSKQAKNYNELLTALRKKEVASGSAVQSRKLTGVIMSREVTNAMRESLTRIILKEKEVNTDGKADLELEKLRNDLQHFEQKPVVVGIYTRSVEGIIYYLGELARRSLNPDFNAERRTKYFTFPARYADFPERKCINPEDSNSAVHGRTLCLPIFVLEAGAVPHPGAFVSTQYDGVVYSVPSNGLSGTVLELVKQALALLSSAKSLPQANVISVVGQ